MAPQIVVMLHALGASGRAWDEVIAALGGDYACFAPDLPGFAEAVGMAETGIAATLDWLTEEIGRRAPAAYMLVGHSMGGKFATLLAVRAEAGEPRLAGLSGVVLLAASPPAPEPMDEARRAAMIGWFADGAPDEADARRFVEDNIAGPLAPARFGRAVADVRRSAPAAWKGWLERGSREDWRDRAGRLSSPATIVAGADDGDLGEANQRRLNLPHYARAKVVVLPGAAHLLPYEQPDAVARLIEEAARAHPDRGRGTCG